MISFADAWGSAPAAADGGPLPTATGNKCQVEACFHTCLVEALNKAAAQPTGDDMAAVQTKAFQTATEAMAMFFDRPCAETAADALVAVSAWDGPLGSQCLDHMLPLLTARQITVLIAVGLELYIAKRHE